VGLYDAAIDCDELAHPLDAPEHLSELVLGWWGECVARHHLDERVASVFVLLYQELCQYLYFCTSNLVGPTADVFAASPLCSAQEPYMLVHALATFFDLALVPGDLEV